MSVPKLVIGDHFAAQFQLKTSTLPNGYPITAATRIAATVVAEDHSERFCDVAEQDPQEDDDLSRGVVTIQLSKVITEQLRKVFEKSAFANLEVKVVVNGLEFSWWHDIDVVPGYIA